MLDTLFALALILSPIILIGGGAALGWFVLPLVFGREAIIPFTVGGAVLGGALLFGLGRWFFVDVQSYGPFRSPEKPWDTAEREHRSKTVWLSVLLCFVLVPMLGVAGWKLGQDKELFFTALIMLTLVTFIFIVIGIGFFVLVKEKWGWIFWPTVIMAMTMIQKIAEGLSWLSDNIRWNPNNADFGSILGIVISPFLAHFLGKLLAGAPPDTLKMRREALLQQVMQNPSSFRDLEPSDQQIVLFELQKLAQATPEAWEHPPLELQSPIPSPERLIEQTNTITGKHSATRSSKPKVEESSPHQPMARVFREPEEGTVEVENLPVIVLCPTYHHKGNVTYSKAWSIQEIYDRDGKLLKPVFGGNWTEIAQGIATSNPRRHPRGYENEEFCDEAICILPEACPVRVVFKCVSKSHNDENRLDHSSRTELVEMVFQKPRKESGSKKIFGRLLGAKRSVGKNVKS